MSPLHSTCAESSGRVPQRCIIHDYMPQREDSTAHMMMAGCNQQNRRASASRKLPHLLPSMRYGSVWQYVYVNAHIASKGDSGVASLSGEMEVGLPVTQVHSPQVQLFEPVG